MDWRKEIKEELFGPKFRLRMNDAFNENLRDLMNSEKNDDGTDQLSVGFGIHKSITKKDVEFLLFENDGVCVKMMKRGEYAQVIALLYMWAYYLFLERSPDNWVETGIRAHWLSQGFHYHLRDDILGGKDKKVHGVVRMGRKKVSNT